MQKNSAGQVRSLRLARPKARSRVTNGATLLPNVDGRTFWVRRFRDLFVIHISDLGGNALSEAERSMVRRACCLEVELERLEQLFALAGSANAEQLDLYAR